VFEHVARRHERDTETRRIAVRIDVADAVDQVIADPDRIEQVVENLVANALRHVPDGGEIQLQAAPAPGGVTLTVTDSGTGIPAEHLPYVFDRFYKADPARAAGASGSGLGLSIVKAIVERHGGHISVTSRPGCTAFTIDLPQAAVAVEAPVAATRA
jgi:signal transduction histidine kinase